MPSPHSERPSGAGLGGARAGCLQYLDFGPFRIDLGNRLLLRGEEPVPLTPKAFDTLLALVERRGRVVAKAELLDAVWPDTFVEEATLTQNVYTLRKALAGGGDDGQRYIVTLPRRGYRFVAKVREHRADLGTGPSPGRTAGGGIASLAVLPFRCLGTSEEDRFLGMGMADALITRLTGLGGLTVRPTSTVARYAGAAGAPARARRELGVDAVVEGSLQTAGGRMRATVQLLGPDDQAPRWADAVDAEAGELFALQDALSGRVARVLRGELSSSEESRLASRHTASREAWEAYVKGRYFWNKRTAEGLGRAVQYFHEAIDRDPAFAMAHAGLADTWVLQPLYGGVPADEAFPAARGAAETALGLDAELAEAHTALAYTRFVYDWGWSAAEAGLRRAMDLNPGYPTAHHWVSFLLAALGRHGEAMAHAARAHELDPLSLPITTDRGLVHYFARHHQEAVEHFTSALELDPAFAYARFGLALTYGELGRHEEAVEEARRALELSGGSTAMLAVLGHALAAAGRGAEAREVLAQLDARAGGEYVQDSRYALVHAGLGESEAALEHLARACEQRSRFVVFLAVWPVYDRLRAHPRFAELLARVGLAASSPAVAPGAGPLPV